MKRVGRDHDQRAHGGHVERRGQRRAHRHPALELAVIVLRDVEPARRGDLRRRIFHQRGRCEPPLCNRLGIQKGLERGARLAQRQHPVDLAGLAELAGRPYPGQHGARGVVQHQHRAVFHMPPAQFAQVLLQALHRKALQRRAQGGGHPLGHGAVLVPLAQQVARKVWRHTLARIERAALQCGRGEQVQRIAIHTRRLGTGALLHVAQHAAGTLRHQRRPCVGRAHQRCCHRGFAVVQAVGRLVEQRAAEGINAHQLAAKRHEVEVSLQDLVLAPAPVQHLGSHRLAQLLHHGAPAGALAPVPVEQTGQLHGDGAGPARALVPQVAPGGGRRGAPVHAAVLKKALVLAEHQGRAQGGRHLRQRHPLAASHGGIGAQALQHLAFAGEDEGVGGAEVGAHFVEDWQRPGRRRASCQRQDDGPCTTT